MDEFEHQAQAWTEYLEPRPVEDFHDKDRDLIIRIDDTLRAIGDAALAPLSLARARVRHPNRTRKS